MEMNLDERVRRRPYVPPPIDYDAIVKKSMRWYAIWWGAMPILVFIGAFIVICSKECTALPWLTFLFAPLISVGLGILWGIGYWVKSSSLPDEYRSRTRRFILLSILWGPALGVGVFYATGAIVSSVFTFLAFFI